MYIWTADRNEGEWSSQLQDYLSSSEYGQKISGLNGNSNPDLCNSNAVLNQFGYQANWELCGSIISP